MVIVGITGGIDHGKTSLGEAFQSLETHATHYESSAVITNLAEAWLATVPVLPAADDIEAINDWLKHLVPLINTGFEQSCSFEDIALHPNDIKEHPENYAKLFAYLKNPHTDLSKPGEANKQLYRPLLQWMGGYLVSTVDDGIWYKQIVRFIKQDEAAGIVLSTVGGLRFPHDGEILKEAGATIIEVERPGLDQTDTADPTERQRQQIKVDCTVYNDGTLGDLQNCARQIYQHILKGSLQANYHASRDLR
ncbi:MAG: hypothetical protein QG553_661 [Patescibacteria group bacterium]|nr:hypothetical protein [Patescibacteria group bacterium]